MFSRPIAHRGFHKINGELENTMGAFRAAITANYAIECDIQLSADGEAMVFHDFTLDRLMNATGALNTKTAAELKLMRYKTSQDTMLTLAELLTLTSNKVPLVIEIKSAFNGDMTLTNQAIRTLKGYENACLMSFDPSIVKHLHDHAPHIKRGIVGQNNYIGAEWAKLSLEQKHAMSKLLHLNETKPHFVSWKVGDLPCPPFKGELICWTVRTPEQREFALHHKAQITFEGFTA
jgi:glycerophosphoryl diester phosphodiesterase